MPIGIIGAMTEEVVDLISKLTEKHTQEIAGLTFHRGLLVNKPVVIVKCGVGKVNAAMCTQILIDHFCVQALINTGVAGGIDPSVEIADVIVSKAAIQHDVDVGKFGYGPGIIPSLNDSVFYAKGQLPQIALQAASSAISPQRVHFGLIISGDQFISDIRRKTYLHETFNALCVEMEGAAIAQVATLNKIPFVIIRTISDKADNLASGDFNDFLFQVIPDLNLIVTRIIQDYSVLSD